MGMKANKKHNVIENGKFYIGGCMNRRKNGRGKIGTTEKELKTRVSVIRSKGEKDFNVMAYITLKVATKARIELVESWVREGLEQKYTHVQNDHFEFSMLTRKEGYETFLQDALALAAEICNMKQWGYTVNYVKKV